MKSFRTNKLGTTIACILAMVPALLANAEEVSPEAVKALYILKLRQFVFIGDPPHMPQTICYYEKPGVDLSESVGQFLAKYNIENPDHSGHPLSVKWFKAIRDFSGCDILYIPGTEEASVPSILTALNTSPIFTISAVPQFIYKGGMVGFLMDDTNHVKMEANDKTMKEKKIRMDAQILEIMQRVIQ